MPQHTVYVHATIVSWAASTAFLFASLLAFPTASPAAERFETPVGFTVNQMGAANLNIPIDVPPGTAGMTPSLSLSYSSQGGNGMLGVGWWLSGLPTIYRCGNTIIQDGITSGVGYTANDRFCLDGQRLVVVANASGVTGVYGANLTEYRTERESFARIVSYGTTGSGPTYFIVQTKGGQTMQYGYTTDSRVEAQGRADIRVWAVNKISDTVGNYMTVSYTEDGTTLRAPNANGDYYPLAINYTSNVNLTPYNSVKFIYQTRSDNAPFYLGGSVIKTMLRLANVQTYATVNGTNTMVKDYQLAYANSALPNNASRLVSATECLGSGVCLPATVFSWQPATGTTGFASPVGWGTNPSGSMVGDFNGDGLPDLLYWYTTQGNTRVYVSYSTGTGFGAQVLVASSGTNLNGLSVSGVSAGDLNGDGKADLLMVTSAGAMAMLSTGNGFAPPVGWGTISNLAGNSLAVDFNGDGLPDLLNWYIHQGSLTVYVSYSTGNGFGAPVLVASSATNFYGYTVGGVIAGDLNGDGKADLLVETSNGAMALLSQTPSPDLLNSVTTGLGNKTEISYTTISNQAVYVPDTNGAYPVRDMNTKVPYYVVSAVTIPDGIGGTRSSNYKYYGAKYHLLGGGFLGFRQYDVTDSSTLIRNSSTFTQDYPHQGLPTSVVQYQSNGNVLHSVYNTWTYATYPDTVLPVAPATFATTKGSKHNFPAITQSVETTNELNQSLVTQVTSSTIYDAYGNPTSVNVATTDGFSKLDTNTYAAPNLTNWIIGRLINSTVQSTSP